MDQLDRVNRPKPVGQVDSSHPCPLCEPASLQATQSVCVRESKPAGSSQPSAVDPKPRSSSSRGPVHQPSFSTTTPKQPHQHRVGGEALEQHFPRRSTQGPTSRCDGPTLSTTLTLQPQSHWIINRRQNPRKTEKKVTLMHRTSNRNARQSTWFKSVIR